MAAVVAGCVARPQIESPGAALNLTHYSARLKVAFDGPQGRGRGGVLLAFERPDRLRIEVPGPTGARMVAVSRGDRVTAVFPQERAIFSGAATRAGLGDLLGVALEPAEIMDLLGGTPPQTVTLRRLRLCAGLACDIAGRLQDGTTLSIKVEDARLSELPAQAFTDPPCPGCRSIGAREAAEIWTR